MELVKKRKALIEAGISLPEQQKGVPAPGMNPTETPEIYMSKIMQNRKRIEQTIKKWEAEQQAKREGSPMPGQDTIDVAPTQQRAIDAA